MPVNTPHPEYEKRAQTWQMIRDAIDGELAVKSAGPTYLPVPPGMPSGMDLLDSGKRIGSDPYSFYLGFAEFPEIVEPTLSGFQGIVNTKPPTLAIPPALSYLEDYATIDGLTLEAYWSTITREILAMGRIGLLIDIDALDGKLRFISYSVENIINWRERSPRLGGGVDMLVLRERQCVSDPKDPFKLLEITRWRELALNNGVYQSRLWEEQTDSDGKVTIQVVSPAIGSDSASAEIIEGWVTPSVFGKTFDFIPFQCINAMDVGFEYQPPPMLPLVRRAYSIYRKSADYNRALYVKGDPQICISGIDAVDAPSKIGGDGIWTFPSPDAKASYLDIDGQGIPLMRQSIQDEYDRFDMEGGKLLMSDKTAPESGVALRRREQSHQVTLRNIVLCVGEAFEEQVKQIALLAGDDPEACEFSPDTDFAEPTMSAQDLLSFVTAKNNGAPIAYSSLHELMRRGGLTTKTFEEEVSAIEEDSILASVLKPVGSEGTDALSSNNQDNPNGPDSTEPPRKEPPPKN